MICLLLLYVIVFVNADYTVPDAKIEALYPKGFRVSIPDEEGIKLFAFHGKLNEELNGREGGTFSRDITKAKNGRWTFIDPYTKLKEGDVLYYWTYVDYFDGRTKLGYTNDDQVFVVKELIDESISIDVRNKVCSSTKSNPNVTNICAGDLIFNENFDDNLLNSKFWTIEQKYADAPDYEFVMYMNLPQCLQDNNGKLKIRPILSEEHFGNGFVTWPKGYDFNENCTATTGTPACRKRYDAGFILPPVISSQISTKNKFSFKYGKIEILAKLPRGDWIYPELYLNPLYEEYGSNYESGQIRIAFAPGNDKLNQVLHGGVILGASNAAREAGMKSVRTRDKNWSDEFHKFVVTWKPESITVSVDDHMYGSIYPPADGFSKLVNEGHTKRWRRGSSLAPFDKEMYLTIGVGVGGFNFQDMNDGTKPWKNAERLSVRKFYNEKDKWKNTWNEDSALEVDYIKIWAV
ncbi:beta-1,3-glucan-binding protein-like [Anoplophora glabripennis]|uniref:beta-1,3-glucan-binding protein-like n=1 Tax=Anoplophora glabripennis TaxID=217634 RepID=UPI0008738745|nr:beta-1,3-glucan-binding protein-like [Anoplophora glabripennis]